LFSVVQIQVAQGDVQMTQADKLSRAPLPTHPHRSPRTDADKDANVQQDHGASVFFFFFFFFFLSGIIIILIQVIRDSYIILKTLNILKHILNKSLYKSL